MNLQEFALKNQIDPQLSEVEIIQSFLIKEYGHLIESMKNISQVEIKEVNLADLKYHDNIVQKYSTLDLTNYRHLDIPIIVLQRNFLLIDGYHRLTQALKDKKLSLMAFVVS